MNQLRNDLRLRIYNRHNQWHMDAFDLYEMGELSPSEALEDIYTILLNAVLVASFPRGMNVDQLCYVIRKGFAEKLKQDQEQQ
jgi:hypothetical protein